ncbi:MAG: DNA primase [Proteobacteria bacterium]|nr:DNA primase [Pseudomonadota bacterium]MBU1059717.1 DNA primase [Pseudomonadota bacterium]
MRYTEFGDDLAAQVKEQADIVEVIGECVELKRAGVRYLGLCPFHGEKTPSFSVHPGQQFFYCFGCAASGDVYSFLMKYHNLDFPAALKNLARRYQIEIPEKVQSAQEQERSRRRKAMHALNEKAAAIFQDYLVHAPQAEGARRYMEERQIPAEIQERFKIGYAPSPEVAGWNFLGGQLDAAERHLGQEVGLLVKKEQGGSYDRFRDRILFPIFDRQGRITGFGGRIVGEGQPKYMNSPESLVFNKSNSLLGLYQQGEEIRRRQQVILVEGNFDLVSLVVEGCPNVVAPLGTALTVQQLKLLKGYAEEYVLLFDGDVAGVKAAMRAVPLFLAEQVAGKVALLPLGYDPDTFIREKGLPALEALLGQAMPLPEFTLQRLVEEHGLTLDGKSRIIDELRPLLKAAVSPLQRSLMLSHFSETIGVPVKELGAALVPVSLAVPPPPPPPEARRKQLSRHEQLAPLTFFQKQMVTHMILYPRSLPQLEKAGIRSCLVGSIGEILYLQLKALIEKSAEVEPEELLAGLPEGGERVLVAEILLNSSSGSRPFSAEETEKELAEFLSWLEREKLERMSLKLKEKMIECAQRGGASELLQQLVFEKKEVDNKLHSLRPRMVS